MKRVMNALSYASLAFFIAAVVYWYTWAHRLHEFNLGEDLHHALGVLDRVRAAEDRCRQATGNFVPLRELGASGCGGVRGGLPAGKDDGFGVKVNLAASGYTAQVHPLDSTRLFSLYLDETGAIHAGTRDSPATAGSGLLAPHK